MVIWYELDLFKNEGLGFRELEKVKNKVESILIFFEFSVLNWVINFVFFEILGNVEFINQEVQFY